MKFINTLQIVGLAALASLKISASAATFDPAIDFQSGYASATNPNGVWSYGYSSTFTSALNLYTARGTGPDSPTEEFWIAPAVNCCTASPAIVFNNGPAFDDGNVALTAHQLDLVPAVFQPLVADLDFAVPQSGHYTLSGEFTGAQRNVGTIGAVYLNNTLLFSSPITAFGQIVPFNVQVDAASGDRVRFAVGNGGGNQNTGFSATIVSAVPIPAAVWMLGTALPGMLIRRRHSSVA